MVEHQSADDVCFTWMICWIEHHAPRPQSWKKMRTWLHSYFCKHRSYMLSSNIPFIIKKTHYIIKNLEDYKKQQLSLAIILILQALSFPQVGEHQSHNIPWKGSSKISSYGILWLRCATHRCSMCLVFVCALVFLSISSVFNFQVCCWSWWSENKTD